MIAKGNLHADGAKLAAYLTQGKEGERAELVELRGFAADNIRDAFTDVVIQAEATRSTKPFFHAYVRLPEGEALAREQWQAVADRIEQRLGFEGQGRAVAFHHGADGETHMHVAWSRIDLETMRAIDPGLYKNKLKETCRELEAELGLTKVRNEREPEEKTRAAGRDEFEQSRRLKTDLKDIRESIRECWEGADSGKAFAAALEDRGLILARGDRRDFVVIDQAGGDHALGKRITGATAAETRARLDDLDRTALPSVEQAKERQQERAETVRTVEAPTPEHVWTGETRPEPTLEAAADGSGSPLPRDDRHDPHAEDMEREDDRGLTSTGDGVSSGSVSGVRVGGAALDAIGSGIGKLAEFISDGILDIGTTTPSANKWKVQPVSEQEKTASGRAWAEAVEKSKASNAAREQQQLHREQQIKGRPLDGREAQEVRGGRGSERDR
jgi:hypothetical protein